MTTGELVDAAALLASTAAANPSGALQPDSRAQWRSLRTVESVCQQWRRLLAPTSESASTSNPLRDPVVAQAVAIEEMLTAEMLLRVWSAAMTTTASASENLGRRMLSHLLVHRRRLLQVLLEDEALSTLGPRIDRLRRVTDRWTDVLLAAFRQTDKLADFCFDPERSLEFCDAWRAGEWRNPTQGEPIVVAALRAALPARTIDCPVRRLAYRELVGVMLGTIHRGSFDGLGRWKVWQRRRLESSRSDQSSRRLEFLN